MNSLECVLRVLENSRKENFLEKSKFSETRHWHSAPKIFSLKILDNSKLLRWSCEENSYIV